MLIRKMRSGLKRLRWGVKNLFRRWEMRKSRREPWMKELRACQDEIATLAPHPAYASSYRYREAYFWLPLLRWMYGDAARRRIGRVLDVGSGHGTLALFCRKVLGAEVYCVDFTDRYMSEELVRRYDLKFAVNNIERDPFPWELRFDVILFTEVIEHLNFHPVPTLRKIRGLLSEGGRVYLSTPDAAEWGRRLKYYSSLERIPQPGTGSPGAVIDDHVWQYSQDELFGVVNAAGFRVLRFAYAPGKPNRHLNMVLEAWPSVGM
jgi:SAM-dependent methyltransferase